MSSNGNAKNHLKVRSKPVAEFIQQIAAREVINITYTDLDGEEHVFGMRNTKEFSDHFIRMNVILAHYLGLTTPQGGYTA